MSAQIRQPNINAPTLAEQLSQAKRYLFQLSEELNWAFAAVEKDVSSTIKIAESAAASSASITEEKAQANFASIKALIIKSADIVNAYYEQINEKLEGEYVAQSDFGVYKEQTSQEIEKTATAIASFYTNLQEIISDIEELNVHLIGVSAHIKSGLLYYDENGVPVYGLEIGQRNTIDGVETFNKYARFISDRLSFYDQNDTEVAYISDYILHITNAEFSGYVVLGKYKVDTSNGLAFKWIGG